MSIEPTEEQKQAAREFMDGTADTDRAMWISSGALARLLAEREAKLRKQLAFMEAGSLADYNAFAEALQKEDAYLAEINLVNERLAEMREVDGRKSRMLYDRDVIIDTLRARVAELESLLHRWVSSYVGGRHGEDARSLVDVTYKALTGAPLAHCDDAKAAEVEATCPKCTDDARPVGDGERWVCSVCRRPCRIPLNDTEGGEG